MGLFFGLGSQKFSCHVNWCHIIVCPLLPWQSMVVPKWFIWFHIWVHPSKVPAADLKVGDEVLVDCVPTKLTFVDVVPGEVTVLKIVFNPDLPVGVFRPSPVIASHGHKAKRARRGRHRMAHEGADSLSIPDTQGYYSDWLGMLWPTRFGNLRLQEGQNDSRKQSIIPIGQTNQIQSTCNGFTLWNIEFVRRSLRFWWLVGHNNRATQQISRSDVALCISHLFLSLKSWKCIMGCSIVRQTAGEEQNEQQTKSSPFILLNASSPQSNVQFGEWSAVCTVRPKSRLVSGEEQSSHVRRVASVFGTHLIVS